MYNSYSLGSWYNSVFTYSSVSIKCCSDINIHCFPLLVDMFSTLWIKTMKFNMHKTEVKSRVWYKLSIIRQVFGKLFFWRLFVFFVNGFTIWRGISCFSLVFISVSFFLPFHSPILKPGFYLSFVQPQGLCKLCAAWSVKIFLLSKCFLEDSKLKVCKDCPWFTASSTTWCSHGWFESEVNW